MQFVLNGKSVQSTADPGTPLIYILRNDFGLNGPKFGCGLGECGACSVLVDRKAARSCVLPLSGVQGRTVTTLEGLGGRDSLSAVQAAFVKHQATQCGYCLNGMIITLTALLEKVPDASEAEIRKALKYNLCRCGAHIEIIEASLTAQLSFRGACE